MLSGNRIDPSQGVTPSGAPPSSVNFGSLRGVATFVAALGLLSLVGWNFDLDWLVGLARDGGLPLLLAVAALVVATVLLAGCIVALLRSTRLRRDRELAMQQSESHYHHAQQLGHIGHWRAKYRSLGVHDQDRHAGRTRMVHHAGESSPAGISGGAGYPTGEDEWSDELYAILGLPRSTVPSLEMKFSRCHPDDWEALEIIEQAITNCHEWMVDHRVIRPDGEVRYIKSHGLCERNGQGDVTGFFGVLIDNTDLELARRAAVAATASKAAFLANMSHEIRTPMNGVMGFVELLMDSKLDAKQRRHLLLVEESAQALLKLLNDILDLSKIDAGHLDLSAEPSNIRHNITQCVRLMTPAAEQKGLDVKVTFAEGFPDNVLIDSLRFRQVLFNLLGNAVKFTNQGSVSVALREACGPNGTRIIEITVADTGVGIAADRKGAIFDAFVQADASVSRRFGGSGLGLSVSRSLTDLMGGTITLESEEDVGTTVTLTLPLDEVVVSALTCLKSPHTAAISGMAKRGHRQASILLVEDVDINQELITEMLSRLGHKVDLARNGAEAVALAHRLAKEPSTWDLILMDVQMPVMDGLTATRAIRALGGRAGTIPIVALTANVFAAEMQACRDAGMDDHVAKPSGFAELKQAVEHWGEIARSPAPPTGFAALETASIADRFETRLRTSVERLVELTAELAATVDEESMLLMREAGGIAHVLAGTAGMFGRAQLGKVALQVEAELKAIVCSEATGRDARATESIGRLIAELRRAPRHSEAVLPVRAA